MQITLVLFSYHWCYSVTIGAIQLHTHFKEIIYMAPTIYHGSIQHDFGYNTVFSWTPNKFQTISKGVSRHTKFIYYCLYHRFLTKIFSLVEKIKRDKHSGD